MFFILPPTLKLPQASQRRPRNMPSPPRTRSWPGREAWPQTRRRRTSWKLWSCCTTPSGCPGSCRTDILPFLAGSGDRSQGPLCLLDGLSIQERGRWNQASQLCSNSHLAPLPRLSSPSRKVGMFLLYPFIWTLSGAMGGISLVTHPQKVFSLRPALHWAPEKISVSSEDTDDCGGRNVRKRENR